MITYYHALMNFYTLIEIFMGFLFSSAVLGVKVQKRNWYFPLFLLTAAVFLLVNKLPYSYIFLATLYFLSFTFLLCGGLTQKLYLSVFIIGIYHLSSYSQTIFLLLFDSAYNFNLFALNVISEGVILLIVYIIIKPVKKLYTHSNLGLLFSFSWIFILYIISEVFNLWVSDGITTSPLIGILSALLCLSFLNAGMFIYYEYSIVKQNETENIILSQEKQILKKEHYQHLETAYKEYNELIHDMNRYIEALLVLEKDHEHDNTLELIETIKKHISAGDTNIYCNRPVLNALLKTRENKARELNIPFDLFIEPGFDIGTVDDFDLIGILSNLIDNALEATAQCGGNRMVQIKMYTVNDGNQKFILIINSTNTDKTKNIRLTPWPNKYQHGIGLKNVKKLVEKNQGLLRNYLEEDKYIVELFFNTAQTDNHSLNI